MNFSCPWSIKLTEKDLLPGAELKAAVFQSDSQGGAHQGGHYVGRRIALQVAERVIHRHHLLESGNDICLNSRVGTLIYSKAGSGVGVENDTEAVTRGQWPYLFCKKSGDVNELHSLLRFYDT